MSPIKLLPSLLALGLLAACSADDDATVTSDLRPVTITAVVDAQMTSRATAAADDPVDRCFVQVLYANGQPLAGGDYASPLPLTKQRDGSFATGNVYLDPANSYKLVFWADGGATYYTVSATSLADITIASGQTAAGIAYRGATGWAADSASTDISCTLTHAVAKVTLNSTTAVEATSAVAISGIREYSQYDAIEGNVKGSAATTLTHTVNGTAAAGELTSFYALVDDQTQDITIAVDDRPVAQQVGSVPLRTNSHVTISGDVASVGMRTVVFNTTVNAAWANEVISTADFNYDPKTNTYTVKTADGLFAWANAARQNLSTNCILANDIDITGRAWTTIQDASVYYLPYTGIFDGANHTITGLSIASSSSDCGLFYHLENATVKDVTFEKVEIQRSGYATTIADVCNNSTISNCHVTGNVVATNSRAAGLILTVNNNSTVSGCSFNGEVSGREEVGGIAAELSGNSTIEGCRVEADITATDYNAGGIVGCFDNEPANDTTKVVGCSFKGTVKAGRIAGGIAGFSKEYGQSVPSIIACHSSGTVSADYSPACGIFCQGFCAISSCYSTTDISSLITLGAIAGELESYGSLTSSIANCFYQSNVTETNAGAKEVDGTDVTWQNAMNTMNAALKAAGYQWQYVDNGYNDPNNKEPLLLLKN